MNRIVDASLSPDLSPRQFKFTSKQGRNRRTKLLTVTLEALRSRPPEEIKFIEICKLANIPRASAYHFFPNIEAIFHGIRLLHAETIIERFEALQEEKLISWKEFIERFIDVAVEVTKSEPAFPRLIYEYRVTNPEIRTVGRELDAKLSKLALKGIQDRFSLPKGENWEQIFGFAFTIADALLKFAQRNFGDFTPELVQESKKATIAYLSLYLKN
ncbi:transcriptional regulator, TetR family [Leptospira ryugenii]|uniref:Transcriptional regulator, TetR family n=1 Tax=Leptospira ryugenii TaxID=1917863 RepID=A0A2P2E3Z3_9LEPT|nr:TetR/AcrR family transcriptional regulator [Leptospira ryugenii]GBF51603.1 transcriptional regulator, TetR family [Leptospira ryugenii]